MLLLCTLGIHDVANLLANNGFHDITIDTTEFQIMYPEFSSLLRDLQLLGESNALKNRYSQTRALQYFPPEKGAMVYWFLVAKQFFRKAYLRRDILRAAEKTYLDMYGDKDGHIPMTLQVIWYMGWKTHTEQK